MKHHLRHDRTCLNCGATVEERFCTRCGQENLVPKESFRHLVSHFFEDVTHYDSKFLVSMRDLLMFCLLPLFALLLKLFYSRKKYFYGDHAIFALHFHSAVLFLFLVLDIAMLLMPAVAGPQT